jgi:hypothetical protein
VVRLPGGRAAPRRRCSRAGRKRATSTPDLPFHLPNFRAILAELAPTPDDRLLEVGGGAFLREEHVRLGRGAGLDDVEVKGVDLHDHARDAGVPEEFLPLFRGRTPFLIARRH